MTAVQVWEGDGVEPRLIGLNDWYDAVRDWAKDGIHAILTAVAQYKRTEILGPELDRISNDWYLALRAVDTLPSHENLVTAQTFLKKNPNLSEILGESEVQDLGHQIEGFFDDYVKTVGNLW
jgi:hypothetical protein